MQMTVSKEIEKALFEAAAIIGDLEVRKAFLDQACNGDTVQRTRLDKLLESHEAADVFFIQAEDARALNSYEVIDAGKGLVRLKIDRAVELTIEEYKNPAAARTNLIARAEKASAPPPKEPEVPSKFE